MSSPTTPVDVVAAVIRRREAYLLCRRAPGERHGGLWEFPGGKVRPGESREEALARELREELQVEAVHAGRVLGAYLDPGTSFRILFIEAAIEGTPCPVEHASIRWILPSEMPLETMAPSDRRFVEERLSKAPPP